MCAVPIGARKGHWVISTVVMVVSHRMCVWYQTQVLIKSRKCCSLLSHLSRPKLLFLWRDIVLLLQTKLIICRVSL